MLQIADGEASHSAVVIGLSPATGQIVYRPSQPVVINLVNLSAWRVVDVVLIVGRGGEGDDPAKLSVAGGANVARQILVDPLRGLYQMGVLVKVCIVGYAVHFKLVRPRNRKGSNASSRVHRSLRAAGLKCYVVIGPGGIVVVDVEHVQVGRIFSEPWAEDVLQVPDRKARKP